MQPLTTQEFAIRMDNLLNSKANRLQAEANAIPEGDQLNGYLSDLNKKRKRVLSSAAKELRRAGRKIDKNKDKILIAAAVVAGAIVAGPAVLAALKTAGGVVAGAAKSGMAILAKGGAIAKTTAVKIGSILAKPFTGTPEEVIEAENVVQGDAWYKKTFDFVKKGLEKVTGIKLDSPEAMELIGGLVLGQRQDLLNGLQGVKKAATQRMNAKKLMFIVGAKWLQGMNPAQQKEAGRYIQNYVNLSTQLKPSQKAVFNDEIRSLVAYIQSNPQQKLLALRQINQLTNARRKLRESTRKKGMPGFLIPALAVGAALTLGEVRTPIVSKMTDVEAAKKAKAEKFFSAIMIQKVKNNPNLRAPTIATLKTKPQTPAVRALIAALSALPGPARPVVVAQKPTGVVPAPKVVPAKVQEARDVKIAKNTLIAVEKNPALKEQVLINLETVPQTPIVIELKRKVESIPSVPVRAPIVQAPLPTLDPGFIENEFVEEKPAFDWAGIVIPLVAVTIPFLLTR